jgi:CheY-like chemotaxis protein
MQNSKPILLVEDDDVDVMTVKRALADLRVGNPLVHSTNGEEALSYLTEQGNAKPCLILLDLNMPKMNGVELLKAIKADKVLKTIPVVVLTTSRSERDVTEIFENGVAGYVVKPADYKKFVEAIRTINLYWALSELPSGV